MPPIAEGSPRGLHLGWIPNDPGRRPRDYPGQPPTAPSPDPAKVRKVQEHQHWSGMRRVLVLAGFLPLILFGGLGGLSHKAMFWVVGAGIAVVFWVAALASAAGHRRAVRALRRDQDLAAERHAVELARHDEAVAAWDEADAERVAAAPHWLGVRAREGVSRLDVFGGSLSGRRTMLAGLGQSLLERHAVIVLDLSQERACEGLIAAARQAGLSYQDYQLPRDLRETPLLDGLTGEQIASQVVEVLHADSHGASTVSRATDLMVVRKVIRALAAPGGAAGDEVTMARVHDALVALLAGSPEAVVDGAHGTAGGGVAGTAGGGVAGGANRALAAEFPGDFRKEVAGSLVRLAAVVEPLRDLGADAAPRPAARLTCLSLAEGPRDVTADLTAALVVQWVTQAVIAAGAAGPAGPGGTADGPRPAVVLAGADEQATRHLARLTAACERYDVPLIRTFSRLTEESARHLDTRNTAFMRLATRAEALRAAEHIGMARSFVAGRFTRSRSVSQSRTTTRGESETHTTGYAQGEAVTKTTGTTEGESLSKTVIKRHNDRAHEGRDRQGQDRDDNSKRPPAGRRDTELRDRDSSDEDTRGQGSASKNGKARAERRPARGGSSGGSSGGRGGTQRPYVFDFMTSRTKHKFTHQSEAKTESWTRTDETSHTRTREWSKTDGTSVGDAITYELTYDHKVAPETLMDLPEDQMLAPQVAEGRSADGKGVAGQGAGSVTPGQYAGDSLAGPAEGKMIALVVDPAVVGSESVAHVQSHEIPAYQPPAPALGPGHRALA
ncbi:MAG TPA: hypothetical protein VHZ03_31885 [Trebonia sp.]|nr:hypothetical protein [Trebonia sp.]